MTSPEFKWALYVFLAWGLGLYFHLVFAFIFHHDHFEEWKVKIGSRRKIDALFLLGIHFASYVGVCSFLFLLDFVTGDRTFGSVWAILGWGIGIFAHALVVLIFTSTSFTQLAAYIRSSDLVETKFFFRVHLILFFVLSFLFVLLNLFIFPHTRFALWIVLGWGIGVKCHGLWVVFNRGHRVKKWRQKKTLELMKQLKQVK